MEGYRSFSRRSEREKCAPGRFEVDLDEDGFLPAEDERVPLVPLSSSMPVRPPDYTMYALPLKDCPSYGFRRGRSMSVDRRIEREQDEVASHPRVGPASSG